MSVERVLIVGYGYAGKRFFQALNFLQGQQPNLAVLGGVCDIDPSRLTSIPERFKTFTNLEYALTAVKPTILALTVNESAHYEVLRSLRPGDCKLILGEKPLTRTFQEASNLRDLFTHVQLSLNLVERYSPIVEEYFHWKNQHPELKLVRVEFFWGKYRIADKRPTMGVLSELSHPLDLVDYLFNVPNWTIYNVQGLSSNFSPHEANLLDSLDLLINTATYPIIGHTSFVWAGRRREIIAHFSDEQDKHYQVTLTFDIPKWDCDSLNVVSVNGREGNKTNILHSSRENSSFPEELSGIYKVYKYIQKSIYAYKGLEENHAIVDYHQALKIQHVLQVIDDYVIDNASVVRNSLLSL